MPSFRPVATVIDLNRPSSRHTRAVRAAVRDNSPYRSPKNGCAVKDLHFGFASNVGEARGRSNMRGAFSIEAPSCKHGLDIYIITAMPPRGEIVILILVIGLVGAAQELKPEAAQPDKDGLDFEVIALPEAVFSTADLTNRP